MAVQFIDLLASNQPQVAYQAAVTLGSEHAAELKAKLTADSRIEALLDELQDWPGPAIASHKSARQFFHKLVFLADCGLDLGDQRLPPVVNRILASLDERGVPTLTMNIGAAYGGSGQPIAGWALCDAPVTLYALLKLGCRDPRLDRAVAWLASLVRPDGFGCVVSASLGSWRGPGKAADPCPDATLVMLKLLLQHDAARWREAIAACAASLLDLWEHSRTKHPYIFYMGDDFRKLKAPFIWYDILHVADTLSRVSGLYPDQRLQNMVAVIKAKETDSGFVPESVYQPWKDWDFGQKKLPSDWLTLCVRRIEARLAGRAGRVSPAGMTGPA
ncbi:MAG: hypothetical protein A2087_09525 [Spirochaetes bacterium GWD1_61_31]|nr:MAG: hypothetical protein A2Y37_13775 [Spirochaetes bacterium GWB1_60_80]OHD39276.1 MAG: hypothetical protein A2087_09525 [Spirochaetes bacterium GWD1_61_31]OHD42090.1 MAG: hypothetical protein A2Y35_07510 [Spirochaetes bacterium GWE1_60_18]OHD60976.1 MAG: hypothetical protein A2Y32_03400 [Spirochaetes bacterium GWF1_60_12]HAP42782.1 hypothetical protein [Spirochaetaceae bacterium]